MALYSMPVGSQPHSPAPVNQEYLVISLAPHFFRSLLVSAQKEKFRPALLRSCLLKWKTTWRGGLLFRVAFDGPKSRITLSKTPSSLYAPIVEGLGSNDSMRPSEDILNVSSVAGFPSFGDAVIGTGYSWLLPARDCSPKVNRKMREATETKRDALFFSVIGMGLSISCVMWGRCGFISVTN